jgi:hypothetical protein
MVRFLSVLRSAGIMTGLILMEKQHILDEIRRTAAANDGAPGQASIFQ